MKILFVRGSFLNTFEGQNYTDLAKNNTFIAVSSLQPIQKILPLKTKQFFSPFDLVTAVKAIHPFLSRAVNFTENRLLGDGHFLLGLERYAKKNGPWDIGWGAETYYGYTLQLARLKRKGIIKKLVTTCWEVIPHNNETIAKKRAIKNEIKKQVDLFICPTKLAKRALITEGVDEKKIAVIGMGVNQDIFYPAKTDRKKDIKTVIFVGRLVEEKGVRDLPYIINYVTKSNNKIHFVIVGEGLLKNWLHQELIDMNLDKFVTIISKRYKEMGEVYRNADLLLCLSKKTSTWAEQYGMVIVEAQSCGLPVIAYNSGAISEVVNRGGIMTHEGDKGAISEEILALFRNEKKYQLLSIKSLNQARNKYNAKSISNQLALKLKTFF